MYCPCTAAALLLREQKAVAHPVVLDSIQASSNQEVMFHLAIHMEARSFTMAQKNKPAILSIEISWGSTGFV